MGVTEFFQLQKKFFFQENSNNVLFSFFWQFFGVFFQSHNLEN